MPMSWATSGSSSIRRIFWAGAMGREVEARGCGRQDLARAERRRSGRQFSLILRGPRVSARACLVFGGRTVCLPFPRPMKTFAVALGLFAFSTAFAAEPLPAPPTDAVFVEHGKVDALF